jgi:SAM-dependent methyltransferase
MARAPIGMEAALTPEDGRSGSHYLHGTSAEEQARLSRLNSLLNDLALREMPLQGGERILDVGAGLGQLSRAMASAAGRPVVGVERSPEQISEALRQARVDGEQHLLDLRPGEANALPLRPDEWGTFDVAHTRFVLEHVPDPLGVVRQMARAVRQGGRVILQDDGHDTMRLWPEPAGFSGLWRAYMRTYDRVGNDPFVGHRLVAMLHQAGLQPVRNTWLFFGACAGQETLFRLYVENLVIILRGVRDQVLALGEMDDRSFEAAVRTVEEWGARPDAAIWYAVSWAEGRAM